MEKLKKQKPSTARSDATAEKQTQLDDIFEQMGDFGRFQLRVFPLFCLCSTLASLQYASVPFVGYTPEHRCISPQNDMDGNQTSQIQHFFSDEHRNQSSACESVVNGSREKCHEWEFDRSVMEETYASEFNLVCDEASLVTLMAVIFLVGMAVGNVGIGLLSDRLGRRTALGCALLFLSASGLASTFSPNAVTAILFRFLIGASSSGAYITSFLFGMEVVGPKKRMFAGIIMHFFYAAGSCGASGIAYALRHWRYLQAAITAPALLLAVYTWTVPESIRWLLSRGRKEDAKLVAKGVAQQNGRHIKSYDIFDHLKVDAVPQKSKGILKELWKTPRLVFHMVLLSLIWGLVEATWFGISLNSGNIEGSIFVNYFLVGLIEFPANCVLFTINRYGRKIPFVLTMVLCGMLCLSTTFVELYTGEDEHTGYWTRIALSIVARFFVAVAYNIIYIWGAEIYPTVMRNAGLSTSSFVSKMLNLLAPVIVRELRGQNTFSSKSTLPLIIFGVISVSGGLASILLPESANKPLPQTIAEVRNAYTSLPAKIALAVIGVREPDSPSPKV